jgi:hypothetical protein
MGLATEMKNLSEDLLAAFRQRIAENEELVSDVQKTLDGFRKDHQDLASVLNANAVAQRKGRAIGEKERIKTYDGLMNGIHQTIASIEEDVVAIQTSTLKMTNDFAADRAQMADELKKSFSQNKSERRQNEKARIKEFDSMMLNINNDINKINNEVMMIFRDTNDMQERFDKQHIEMSAELRAELGNNLAERVKYTGTLLTGFQKRLSEISKENQKMAQNLRRDLAHGESRRLGEYTLVMKGIHNAISTIGKDVNKIQKATASMLGDLSENRVQASAEWSKMQNAMDQIRNTGLKNQNKEKAVKVDLKMEKKEVKAKPIAEVKAKVQPKEDKKQSAPLTLEERVMEFIINHPEGVKVSEMEEPLGEIRMKLGFAAKNLLNEGKVQKVENIYFPVKA